MIKQSESLAKFPKDFSPLAFVNIPVIIGMEASAENKTQVKVHLCPFTANIPNRFKLISSDLGRRLSDVMTILSYVELEHSASKVLHGELHLIEPVK